MMRSLYSGVAGLKTHQTKMDVIGNNIANTNTVGFKSSSVNFSDTYYQTVSSATGPNTEMATAGTNAKQIGLGSMVAAIQTNITEQGGPSTTNRALDIAINGEAFMVVRSGTDTCFTKAGALNIDPAGNLYCTTNGATVQGWLVDKTTGNIIKDTVKDLKVMSTDNMYSPPEATKCATISGNVDPNDPELDKDTGSGKIVTFSFFDNIGEAYTVKIRIKQHAAAAGGGGTPGTPGTPGGGTTAAGSTVDYDMTVVDVMKSDGTSMFVTKNANGTYTGNAAVEVTLGSAKYKLDGTPDATTGEFKLKQEGTGSVLQFNNSTGTFSAVSTQPYTGSTVPDWISKKQALNFSITNDGVHTAPTATTNDTTFPFYDSATGLGGVQVYFNSLTQYSQGGVSKISSVKGREVENGYVDLGHTAGKMKGVSVDEDGIIWGSYDNGVKNCLGQIAFATFANPSGLESLGNSLFGATQNSGEFDGIGEEIGISGSLTAGALEMSNVDLANEFTQMITTQRGFQANSRIITTSDSMLEELVNLKR